MFAVFVRRVLAVALVLVLAGTLVVPPANAQITESRDSSANPMVEVFKSTIYGGLAGLVLGGALAWAMSNDNSGDAVKWSFVSGTFFGFGYGIYHVTTRPQPRAMLEHGTEGWALALPTVSVERNAPLGMPAPVAGGGALAGPATLLESRGFGLQATLATFGF